MKTPLSLIITSHKESVSKTIYSCRNNYYTDDGELAVLCYVSNIITSCRVGKARSELNARPFSAYYEGS